MGKNAATQQFKIDNTKPANEAEQPVNGANASVTETNGTGAISEPSAAPPTQEQPADPPVEPTEPEVPADPPVEPTEPEVSADPPVEPTEPEVPADPPVEPDKPKGDEDTTSGDSGDDSDNEPKEVKHVVTYMGGGVWTDQTGQKWSRDGGKGTINEKTFTDEELNQRQDIIFMIGYKAMRKITVE